MHTSFLLNLEILQRAMTLDINVSAEIDEYPSQRFQDIREKPVSRTDTWTDRWTGGRTDNVKTVHPTTNKVCEGYNKKYQKHFIPGIFSYDTESEEFIHSSFKKQYTIYVN